MSGTSDAMNGIVVNVVRLARKPGLALLIGAAVPVAVFTLLAALVGRAAISWVGWIPLVLALALALPVVVLAVRRQRLQRTTESLSDHQVVTGDAAVVVHEPQTDAQRAALQAELDTLSGAMEEGRLRTARWLPRVEATQRSLLRAAGGPVNAPYLRDDLRVTLVAFLGTVAAIPLGALGAIVSAFLLLLG